MLAESLRRTVDALWDRVWSAGVTNPMAVVDYLTSVLLLRTHAAGVNRLAEIRLAAERKDRRRCAKIMADVMTSFSLTVPDVALWADTALLVRVLDDVKGLDVEDRNCDILGDCFEHILGHLSTAGDFGQFRTPRHIVKFLVEAVSPQAGETVLDPACGTGGFLIAAHEYRRSRHGAYLGDECDWTMARIASANLVLHGIRAATIRKRDALAELSPEADVILTNPPFAGTVSKGRQEALGVASSKSELLFLELMLRRLKPEGRAGSVVPFSVLTSPARPAVCLRQKLVEKNSLTAVIELPSGVFRPYTDVRTALLLWGRSRPKSTVLMMRAKNDGYSLDERREPIPDNDLPMLLGILKSNGSARMSGQSHARSITVAELRRYDYALNPSRFLEHGRAVLKRETSLTDALGGAVKSASRLRSVLQRIEELTQ